MVDDGNRHYNSEVNRLHSFSRWNVPYISKELLARYGFYYIGPGDLVGCHFCQVEIGMWEPTDNVLSEHIRWSPRCPLLRKRSPQNIPIDPDFLNEELLGDLEVSDLDIDIRPLDVCGCGYMRVAENVPSYPKFALEAARLTSFEDWPRAIKARPAQLADAGFFYTGKGDKVNCFSCGGGLKDWDDTDEPWEQHAIWYPECVYLNLVKGSDFVKQISLRKNTTPNEPIPTPSAEASETVEIVEGDEENKMLRDHRCRVCMINELDTVFEPCGHVVACAKCASSVTKCPMCRRPYQKVSKIYFCS